MNIYEFDKYNLGVILIFLGLAIIASRTGYLPPGFWLRLADFWPFIFIILGLSIIARNVKRKLPFVIIIVALIIIPFIVATVNPVSYTSREERSEDITVPFDSAVEEVWLTIDSGAGNFKVSGGSKDIASGRFSSNYARLVKDITKSDKRLDIKYKTEGVFKRDMVISSGKTEMNLFLNDSIPYTITLNLGASKLDIDRSWYKFYRFEAWRKESRAICNYKGRRIRYRYKSPSEFWYTDKV